MTSEKEMQMKEKATSHESNNEFQHLSEEIIYKIEIPANRTDLLCVEGIAQALKVYLEKMEVPKYVVNTPTRDRIVKMTVKASTQSIRPYVVCAILRDITFTPASYQSFIDLQDKLHQNICRKRTLVAIGTHDFDSLTGPFTYEALPPSEIKFKPLNESREFTATELFRYYQEEKKQNNLKQYLHIIEDSPVYPVIFDSKRNVLSLPPIINSEHSKIHLHTKNVLIECTATDYTKAKTVLNTILANFSVHCKVPYSFESVEITYESNKEIHVLPHFSDNVFETSVDYINRGIGINLQAQEMVQMLSRMQLPAHFITETGKLRVLAPPTRSDVLHPCDIMEDVAIGFGYNNIRRTLPATSTVAAPFPLNKLSDQLREVMASCGYTETLTFALCSKEDNFDNLRRPDDGKTAVVLEHAKSELFQIARTTLLHAVLNTIKSNKGMVHLPVKVFELSDVLLLDPSTEVGARNERRLCALYGGVTSGFEFIHGLVDRLMLLNNIAFEGDLADGKKSANKRVYSLSPSNDEALFPGRRVDIIINDKKIGVFGIFHPQVLEKFQINHPCSVVEINVEAFL